MSFEVGQRVVFRSLQWEVADTSSEISIELFGRSSENQGRRIRVLLDLEPIVRAEIPFLTWTIGKPGWDVRQWKALHDAFRFTLSHSRGNLASVDWGRLVLEPYQLEPLQRIENLPFPRRLEAVTSVKRRRLGEEPLFVSEMGRPLTENGIALLFGRLRKRAGITRKGVSPTLLRDTFAVRYLHAGGDVFTLRELLGQEESAAVKRSLRMSER